VLESFFLNSWVSVFFWHFWSLFSCVCKAFVTKAFLPSLSTRLLWRSRGRSLAWSRYECNFLNQFDPAWNPCIMLLRNRLIRAIWFAETLRRPFFIFPPPVLTSSSGPYRNFSKVEQISNKFLRNLPLKKLCQHFFTRLLHRPGPLLLCLVVAIPLVCWLYMSACVCVPLHVHLKMCR